MTLGGLALAVGILVDDATVTIENIERYLEDGQPLHEAILDGAAQIAVPALVSTLCICIVFVPMFLLKGVARYLFVPLAEAVVFAMLASYVLSRTLVPTLAMYLLRRKPHDAARSRNPLAVFQRGFERGFERMRDAYRDLLDASSCAVAACSFRASWLAASRSSRWCRGSARTSSRTPTAGSSSCTCAPRPARASRKPRGSPTRSRPRSARSIPPRELDAILDNIGLPYSGINLTHTTSGAIGAADADIMVSLKPDHRPTADYVARSAATAARNSPASRSIPAGRHRHARS